MLFVIVYLGFLFARLFLFSFDFSFSANIKMTKS